MKKILKSVRANVNGFLSNIRGATVIEYVVLAALIIVVCIVAIQSVGTKANTTFSQVNSSLPSQ